jgi:hypothetical protein
MVAAIKLELVAAFVGIRTGVACGAKIDEGDRRTVPVVSFVVDRTAKDSSAK